MRYLALVALLAGCSSVSVLDQELPKLLGQPVDVAVARFGLPTSEHVIMGQRVYVWSNSEQNVTLAPVVTFGRPMTTLAPVATVGTCQVRLAVDAAGIIRRWDWQGDSDTCYRYSDRLRG